MKVGGYLLITKIMIGYPLTLFFRVAEATAIGLISLGKSTENLKTFP